MWIVRFKVMLTGWKWLDQLCANRTKILLLLLLLLLPFIRPL